MSDKYPLERLKEALQQREFVLYYQPQVGLAQGRVSGMEALIRWQHPLHGLVPPYAFISQIEQSALIHAVGLWVIDEVCRQQSEWQQAGQPIVPVGINVSGRQLMRQGFARQVQQVVRERGTDPHLVGVAVEVTEGVFIKNTERVVERLRKLRDLGFEVHLDDFGTGYSSLSYLRRLPLTHLKVDQSFIRDLGTPYDGKVDAANLTKAIIDLGHSLTLKTIAEGVDSEKQLNLLADMGCDMIQGYWFSRPQPASQVWSTVQEINRAARSYRFSAAMVDIGDYFIRAMPQKPDEIERLRAYQRRLLELVGGSPIDPPRVLCQHFRLENPDLLESLIRELHQELKFISAFPLTAVGLVVDFSESARTNMLRWRVENTPLYRALIRATEAALETVGVTSLKYPGRVAEHIGALIGVPPVIQQNYRESIRFPHPLFVVSRLSISRAAADGSFEELATIDLS